MASPTGSAGGSKYDFKGKVALITGGNRPNGFGRALALKLLERGASRVYVTGRAQVSKWASTLESKLLVPLQLDVTDEASVRSAAASVPHLDILVNNSGTLQWFGNDVGGWLGNPEAVPAAINEMQVNYIGAIRVLQAFYPKLKQAKDGAGLVITLGSVASRAYFSDLRTYSASKAAVDYLHSAIAPELETQGIRSAILVAGAMDTDMNLEAPPSIPKAPPADVADAALEAIASGNAAFVFPDPIARSLGGKLLEGKDAAKQAGFAPMWMLGADEVALAPQ